MKNLNEMKVAELKEMAKGLKISNWWNLKKEVLIKKIEEATASDEEKKEIDEQKAKENAAVAEYRKNWGKYTRKWLSPVQFVEKLRAGEIIINEAGEIEVLDEDLKLKDKKSEENLVPMPGTEKLEELKKEYEQPKAKRGALLEYNGKAQNICAWGKELGISPNTLYARIYTMGWSIEKAFTTAARKK